MLATYVQLSHNVLCCNWIQPVPYVCRLSDNIVLQRGLTSHTHRAPSVHTSLTPIPLKVLPIHHQASTSAGVKLAKVERIVSLPVDTSMLNLCSNLVMYDSLLVFAYDVDAQLQNVLLSEFSRLRLFVLLAQPHAIDERAIAALDILDENAALAVRIDFGVLARKHL